MVGDQYQHTLPGKLSSQAFLERLADGIGREQPCRCNCLG